MRRADRDEAQVVGSGCALGRGGCGGRLRVGRASPLIASCVSRETWRSGLGESGYRVAVIAAHTVKRRVSRETHRLMNRAGHAMPPSSGESGGLHLPSGHGHDQGEGVCVARGPRAALEPSAPRTHPPSTGPDSAHHPIA